YLILMAAALCRDTGFLLAIAWILPLLTSRRFRDALRWSTALIPAIAWNIFITFRVPQTVNVPPGKLVPFMGWLEPILHPLPYPLTGLMLALVRTLDVVQLLGLLLAFLAALRYWRDVPRNPLRGAAFLFALLGLLMPALWPGDPYYARIFSPL